MGLKPYTRRLNDRTFRLIGSGLDAYVWAVRNRKSRKVKVIRAVKGQLSMGSKKKQTILDLKRRYILHRILHLLFPENSIHVRGVDLKKGRMVSRLVPTDRTLKQWMAVRIQLDRLKSTLEKDFFTPRQLVLFDQARARELIIASQLYERALDPVVVSALNKIACAGLYLDADPRNISIADPQNPVFFEPEDLDSNKLLRFLEANKTDYSPYAIERVKTLAAEYVRLRPVKK